MSVAQHRQEAPQTVRCMVVTVSDTRTKETDKSGALLQEFLRHAGHQISHYDIVKDEYNEVQEILKKAAQAHNTDAVLLNGGTGIAQRDITYEAVQSLLDKELHGFGELFRYLSYTEDIGSAAILSRAVAGVYQNTAVFSMPGSSGAVRLAMNKLIIPELAHVIREVQKDL
ncbi:MogA/MoaB family molybdenum cofactor biosynthesis protein [Alteribacillus persepolensis]|nr:molybdenum cofactor biosynthesis protein B [Alteribacillus persepolensis]